MAKFRENSTPAISSIREEFQSVVNSKLAEIAELQVHLMNMADNIQNVDEKMDILFKTFASMTETTKAELVELVRSASAQSASTDRSKITQHISTCFGSLTSHMQTLFDEAKKREGREKPIQPDNATDFATTENLLATVDAYGKRLDILDQFCEEVTEKMERSRQRHVVTTVGAGPSHRTVPSARVTRSHAQQSELLRKY